MTPAEMAALYARAFDHGRPWSAEEIAALAAPPGFALSAPDGFALGRSVAGEAELLTIAVAPEAREQGQGSALLRDFEDEAQARGAKRAFLEVAADNRRAIRLYESARWQRIAQRKGYYARPDGPAVDAYIYEKSLAEPQYSGSEPKKA